MFTPYQTIEKVKETFLHNGELIICHSDPGKGVGLYRNGVEEKVSDIAPWCARIFNDYFLFQGDNGGPVHYLSFGNGSSLTSGTIEGAYYLFRSMQDGEKIYIPTKQNLLEFDGNLHQINSYERGRMPVAVHNGCYYRVHPHLSGFSLQDDSEVWTMQDDYLMEDDAAITGSYLYHKNDLLIVRSKFTDDDRNYVTAFRPAEGTIAWQQEGYFPYTIVLGDHIYLFYHLRRSAPQGGLFTEGKLLVLDSKTGAIVKEMILTEELERHGFRTSDYYTLATQGPYLYISAADNKTLYALNTESGLIAWKHSLKDIKADWLGDVKVYNGDLFVVDEGENLHVLKREG